GFVRGAGLRCAAGGRGPASAAPRRGRLLGPNTPGRHRVRFAPEAPGSFGAGNRGRFVAEPISSPLPTPRWVCSGTEHAPPVRESLPGSWGPLRRAPGRGRRATTRHRSSLSSKDDRGPSLPRGERRGWLPAHSFPPLTTHHALLGGPFRFAPSGNLGPFFG